MCLAAYQILFCRWKLEAESSLLSHAHTEPGVVGDPRRVESNMVFYPIRGNGAGPDDPQSVACQSLDIADKWRLATIAIWTMAAGAFCERHAGWREEKKNTRGGMQKMRKILVWEGIQAVVGNMVAKPATVPYMDFLSALY